jgi:hypothetical protein
MNVQLAGLPGRNRAPDDWSRQNSRHYARSYKRSTVPCPTAPRSSRHAAADEVFHNATSFISIELQLLPSTANYSKEILKL